VDVMAGAVRIGGVALAASDNLFTCARRGTRRGVRD
jgi:hypothetical protein